MTVTGISNEALAQHRAGLDRIVRNLRRVPVSSRAERMVRRIVAHADMQRRYVGTGLHSYAFTVLRMERTQRTNRHVLIGYAVGMGGCPRTAARYARKLALPHADLFHMQRWTLRWIGSLERRAMRRAS